jgi:hypothetical protein
MLCKTVYEDEYKQVEIRIGVIFCDLKQAIKAADH